MPSLLKLWKKCRTGPTQLLESKAPSSSRISYAQSALLHRPVHMCSTDVFPYCIPKPA